MQPTRRAIYWAAGTCVLGLVAALLGGSETGQGPTHVLALLSALGLIVALIVDGLRTPSSAALAFRRELPARVGLGRELERLVRIEADARWVGLRVELRESFPHGCGVVSCTRDGQAAEPLKDDPTGGPDSGKLGTGDLGAGKLEAGAALRLTRRYLPRRRGPFQLGHVRLTVQGRWGLIERRIELEGAQPFDVEPALLDLTRTLSLAANNRWRELGVRRTRRLGGRSEFESLRDYALGDDPRTLDWKATARRGRATVRQYQVERGQELILLVDCGRRMRATAESGSERGWTKLDWALDAALQVAAVALQRGDRVGALAFDARVRAFEPPGRGLQQLERLRRALFALQPSTMESDYAHALRTLAVRHRRRALVLVVSDVADPLSLEPQRRALTSSAGRHRLVFAALDDPDVRRLAHGDEPAESEPAGQEGALRAAKRALALEHDRDRHVALRRLASGGVRVVSPLPAESAPTLLTAWLAERGA